MYFWQTGWKASFGNLGFGGRATSGNWEKRGEKSPIKSEEISQRYDKYVT